MSLAALPVALPLLVAALLMALGRLLPSRWPDLIATLAALVVAALCAVLVMRAVEAPIVAWMGAGSRGRDSRSALPWWSTRSVPALPRS